MSSPSESAPAHGKVLVFTPIGRDTDLIRDVLSQAGIQAQSPSELSLSGEELLTFGALLIGEEALDTARARVLISALQQQPVWSDLPVIILASSQGYVGPNRENAQEVFHSSNVTFLQRPVPMLSLVSTVRAALRARTRQYEVKDLLEFRERQLQERDAFLAMLGHELRNPLAPVRNAIYVWKAAQSTEAQREKARESMERQVQHMSRLVDDLLDVARVSRGKISLRKERTDLTQLIRSVVEDHRGQVEKAGISIELRIPPYSLWVEGDRTRLCQVFGNLIQNAMKFTDKGGRFRVVLEELRDTQQALVGITDSGIGMSRETLSRIFEPFNQGDGSLERNRGGLGLGLAVARKLVELHGGKIEASSAGLGQGSTLCVSLPLLTGAAAGDAQVTREHGGAGAQLVLLVEDNPDAAETTKIVLELMGHKVVHAPDGKSAIETARETRPDIIICDIGLPGMSGYDVAAVLRTELRNCRLIALTGYGQHEDHRRARDAGFDVHLTKPVDPAVLEGLLAPQGARTISSARTLAAG